MQAHAALALECQVPQAIVAENGQVLQLAPGRAEIVGEVPSGRLALDGTKLVPLSGELMRERHRLAFSGTIVASMVVDHAGRLAADPQVSAPGLVDPQDGTELLAELMDTIRDTVEEADGATRRDDDALREAVRRAVRRTVHGALGKKPLTDIHLVRLR
jgi:ribonuclease J